MALVKLASEIIEGVHAWLTLSYDNAEVARIHHTVPAHPATRFTIFWQGRSSTELLHHFVNGTTNRELDQIGALVFLSRDRIYIPPRVRLEHFPSVPLPRETELYEMRQHIHFIRYEIYKKDSSVECIEQTRYALWSTLTRNLVEQPDAAGHNAEQNSGDDDLGLYINTCALDSKNITRELAVLFANTVLRRIDAEHGALEIVKFVVAEMRRRFFAYR